MHTDERDSTDAQLAADCAIATWFVADDERTATYFPQIESQSDSSTAQAIYWRCIVDFFASSLAVNPTRRHILFTNADIPVVDDRNLADMLDFWGVEIIHLEITRRLPPNSVTSWGNQFYVFDIIQYWADTQGSDGIILLDSDCVWLKSANEIVCAIRQNGIVGYKLEAVDHSNINGLSASDMAQFLARHSEIHRAAIPYYAGEFIAASGQMIRRIAELERYFWPAVLEQTSGAPREEAHLLSIIYAMLEVESETHNRFIRRIWTTFRFNDVNEHDLNLTIWHLPAEKRTGFADLFRCVTSTGSLDPRRNGSEMGLSLDNYAKLMGIPRRRPKKFIRDFFLKLRVKLPRLGAQRLSRMLHGQCATIM